MVVMTRKHLKLYTPIWLCGALLLACSFQIVLAYPLCTDMAAPTQVSGNLSFCSAPEYRKRGCCSLSDDNALQQKFNSMNISDSQCAAIIKQILCANCDAFSATLFGQVTQDQRGVPYLCTSNSSSTSNSTTGSGFCHDVWEACLNVTIQNSPFSPDLSPISSPPRSSFAASSATKDGTLGSVFSSEAEFCAGFGPSSAAEDFCFSGTPFVPPPAPSNFSLPQDVCVEKVGTDIYLNMVPLPDGSNRVALTNQAGKVWLATLPGPGNAMRYNISNPFLDISSRVTNQNELGFLGFAFHPDYKDNGRFFVSYNCDKQLWADCSGTCACNPVTNCNPSDLRSGQQGGDSSGADPCRYSSVIAEYTVNSSSGSVSPLEAGLANPIEVRRIFTMSLPYASHHAGQILFGPLDKYLYFMMGDGGDGGTGGDPYNFAQNKKSLLGKILRLDVDEVPSAVEISALDLSGEYAIPPSNPFAGQNDTRPEIWAMGLRNPWRCSFDSQSPTYFYCGDVGQEKVEEVNLISKGGNYGWRVYEGNYTYVPLTSPGGNTSARSIKPIFPVMGYLHPVSDPGGSYAAITGGYVSYSRQDPCLYGKYVYADLFGAMYAGAEVPKFSGNYQTQQVNYQCSSRSPMNCTYSGSNTSEVAFQEVLSFGTDNYDNLYILTASGLHRIVHPSNCNNVCNAVLPALPPSPAEGNGPSLSPLPPAPSPRKSSANKLRYWSFTRMFWSLFICALVSIRPSR